MKQLKSIGALSQAMRSIAVVIVGIYGIGYPNFRFHMNRLETPST